MVVATRDKRSRRVVSADGRIKFHSKERGNAGMYWDQWENMSPTEQQWYCQNWPDFVPGEAAEPLPPGSDNVPPTVRSVGSDGGRVDTYTNFKPVNPYEGRLRFFNERIAVLDSVIRNAAESDDRRARAAADIEQYYAAIEVYTEAGTIPADEEAWFVTNMGEFKVQIPPVVEGVYDRYRDVLRSSDHYFFARKNPLHIAVLRRAARNPMNRIWEKPPQTFPIIDYAHSEFEHWVSGEGAVEAYFARQNKRYKPI